MFHDITYKTFLNNNNIINKLFENMSCEACGSKFSLFKKKKQCKDCLRFYCRNCIVNRDDRVLNCANCIKLSRRPLIRSQVIKIKSKDIKQYLIAQKVSTRGCLEKEELVNILIQYANGGPATEEDVPRFSEPRERTAPRYDSSPRRSRSPPTTSREIIETPDSETEQPMPHYDVDVEEVASQESFSLSENAEPIVVEPSPETEDSEAIGDPPGGISSSQSTSVITEVMSFSGIVKINDVADRKHLQLLNVRQLKEILTSNRVDFRGCVERIELLDRVERLWDSHKQSKEDVNDDRPYEENVCKVCWDSPIECVLLECGHMACCVNCGKQMNECPICRQYVVRVVRFFKA